MGENPLPSRISGSHLGLEFIMWFGFEDAEQVIVVRELQRIPPLVPVVQTTSRRNITQDVRIVRYATLSLASLLRNITQSDMFWRILREKKERERPPSHVRKRHGRTDTAG